MKTKILADFQIYISVPLKDSRKRTFRDHSFRAYTKYSKKLIFLIPDTHT